MKKKTKFNLTFLGGVGIFAAISEFMLYFASNTHADLTFVIKKSANADKEKQKDAIRYPNIDWFKTMNAEEFYIKSSDNLALHAYYLPAEGHSDKTAFCIHGIQSNGVREFATSAKYFYENGINTFIIDQRGCGKSEGKYTTYGYKEAEDCKRWLDFISRKFGRDMKVFVYGTSMGGTTTLLLNNHELPGNVKYLVADCGYASAKEQIKFTFKSVHLPAGICYFAYKTACLCHNVYNPDRVDALSAVSKCRMPIIFIHGDCDDVVPTENVYKLYEAAGSKDKTLIVTDNVGHAQSFALSPKTREAIIAKILKD